MPSIQSAILGEGTMDFEVYVANMSRIKYPRVLLIEHLPWEEYARSKKCLEDTAARRGVKIYK